MMNEVLKLLLYRAHCQDDGIQEGRFVPDTGSYGYFCGHRYIRAARIVWKYLSNPHDEQAVHISGLGGIAASEKEARDLILLIQHHIEGAVGTIEPIASTHGQILFDRSIRFDAWLPNEKTTLIERLVQCGTERELAIPQAIWESCLRIARTIGVDVRSSGSPDVTIGKHLRRTRVHLGDFAFV